jgi:sugar phosphate isomerase/epimerase
MRHRAPMRLAGHTYTFRDCSLEAALDQLVGLGFVAVEVWAGHLRDDPEAERQKLEMRGLELAALGAGGFYTPDPSGPERAFALARALGTSRIVACASRGALGAVANRVPDDLILCLENHWDQALATPRDLQDALATSKRVRACLDTGHALIAGFDPATFAAALGSNLVHVHLKDAFSLGWVDRFLGRRARQRLGRRPPPAFPGTGALAVPRLRASLEAVGFGGFVSVEYEGQVKRREAMAELLRRWRDQ